MANVNVTIKNIDEIRSAFSKAPKDMADELNKAIDSSLLSIGRVASENSPFMTGNMRSSILDKGRGLELSQGRLRGSVGPTPFYSIFVHDGTRYMKARPFLFDAVNAEDYKVQDYFRKAVDNVLAKIARDSK